MRLNQIRTPGFSKPANSFRKWSSPSEVKRHVNNAGVNQNRPSAARLVDAASLPL